MLLYFLYCVRCLVFRSFLFVWLLSFFDYIYIYIYIYIDTDAYIRQKRQKPCATIAAGTAHNAF